MRKDYHFPQDFWWGAATSATQTEGKTKGDGSGENIWDYASKHYNEKFYEGITSQKTSTFYQHHQADIKRAADIHFNSLRTSISWSRLIPDGTGKVNAQAVAFYNQVIDEMIAQGIEPFINLYHFDMPMALQKIGGFENRVVVDAYANYAKTCFELFGDRVKYWFTFNEPMIPAEAGYLHARHYPYVQDFQRDAQVLHNIVMAHCKAIAEFRKMELDAQIGIIMDVIPVYARSTTPEDEQAAFHADLFYTRSINEAIILGKYPEELIEILKHKALLPEIEATDLQIMQTTKIDLLGINYYRPRRVKAKETAFDASIFTPDNYFDEYIMPNRQMNESRGIEIYPKGIYDIAKLIQNKYGNIPWFVSENGMGIEKEEQFMEDGMVIDDYHIDFLKEHLQWLHKAIVEGSHCLGYHMWTFIDCWSWVNAYKNRYGFYRLDYETQQRSLKKSGYGLKPLLMIMVLNQILKFNIEKERENSRKNFLNVMHKR